MPMQASPHGRQRRNPSTDGARFRPDVGRRAPVNPLKGAGALDWGMQSRLARIFAPATSRTVMLAIDHGYFQGPTTGLERVDLSIVPLLPLRRRADDDPRHGALDHPADRRRRRSCCARAAARACCTDCPTSGSRSRWRTRSGSTPPRSPSRSSLAASIETQSVAQHDPLVDEGQRAGIPVLAVTAVGRELTRDARYLRLAVRICAELGAQVVKTYYCAEDFDTVTAGCPVPVVMAGGKKLPERDALVMAYQAIDGGAAGRRHGPQHLPERPPGRDDPRDSRGGARIGQAGARLRGVRAAGHAGS